MFLLKLMSILSCLYVVLNGFKLDDYQNLIEMIKNEPEYQNEFNENLKTLLEIDPNYFNFKLKQNLKFDCDTSFLNELEPATSVNNLKPSDIKVVGALGDSLTAALGAKSTIVTDLLFEYRGVSWSIGGDSNVDEFVTIPNILKKFNPQVTGFSTGKYLSLITKKGAALNVAVSGQEANHIHAQAALLIQRIKEMKNVDFNNDWKLITLFIGGNDICDYCKDKNLHSPQAYIEFIEEALDLLQKELPKTLVNLVSVLNVGEVKLLNKGLVCSVLHTKECPCAAYPKDSEQEAELYEYLKQYQNYTEKLVESGKYNIKEDFTVVVQPFFKDFLTPKLPDGKPDLSYFAPDCFHFSLKSHAYAAIGLWNNMLQPVGSKATTWNINEKIACPTKEHPYFYTKNNS